MSAGVVQIEGFLTSSDPTHQTLIKPQAKLANLLRIQSFGRAKDQLLARFVVEINRADIGVHGSPDLGDDQSERIFE